MVDIRYAHSSDALALHRLQQGIYKEDVFFVGDRAHSSQQLSQHLRHLNRQRNLYLVAFVEQNLAAYLELNRFQAKKLAHSALLTVAVAPDFRQQGIGRALLHRAYTWCDRVRVSRIELEVRASNIAAYNLYEDEGFILEGRKIDNICIAQDTFEDTLLMVKFLPVGDALGRLESPNT